MSESNEALRVVVFNDSPTVRSVLRATLLSAPDFSLVGEAADGVDAAAICERYRPDLVLMDAMMPTVNGFEATQAIMARAPVPIIIVSAVLDPKRADVLFQAMKAGALFVVPPPSFSPQGNASLERAVFLQTLRNVVAATTLSDRREDTLPPEPPERRPPAVDVIGICASAGGPAAVTELFGTLAGHRMPPILLVQHLAPGFHLTFAQWLGSQTGMRVQLAQDGEALQLDTVYLAPGESHLRYRRGGVASVTADPPIGQFRPSATALLESLSAARHRARGVVLSGMGDDGAVGAVALRRSGGKVVVQDRASSAVYGMPKAALQAGGADDVLDPRNIGCWLVRESRGIHD